MAIFPSCAGTDTLLGQVDDTVFVDEIFILQSRLDPELAVLHKHILVGACSFREVSVATHVSTSPVHGPRNLPEPTNLYFLGPYLRIKLTACRKVHIVDRAVGMIDDTRKALVRCESNQAKSNENAHQR